MPKAYVITDQGEKVVLADSNQTIRIEGNHYFPPDSVNDKFFEDSENLTNCYWKGDASYKTVKIGGQKWQDAAWYYPAPMPSSIEIVKKDFSNYFAFWHGVQVTE